MNAGRELDALVAEHVMGYVWRNGISGRLLIEPGGGGDILYPEEADMSRPLASENAQYREMFHYSTDISAAWQVVERIIELGQPPTIYAPGATYLSGEWRNLCPEWRVEIQGDNTWVETAPLAICLAALRAVGVEVTE